ncbi:MAG TPA: ABC transporter permease [Verrucomicrobiae bacterium]|nr:ABC transporter permease [Verrucomicrobiae bacterium]
MSRLPFELLLALRYLRPKRTFVSVITLISVLGVTLGVAVLIIVISVMSGFDRDLKDKVFGLNSHITIVKYDPETHRQPPMSNAAQVMQIVNSNKLVKGSAPFVLGQVVLQTEPETGKPQIQAPYIRGIDPLAKNNLGLITSNILDGTNDVSNRGLLVGVDLARNLEVQPGDRLVVATPDDIQKMWSARTNANAEIPVPPDYEVRGVFDSGFYEYNNSIVITSLQDAQDLFKLDDNVQGVMVMLHDPLDAEKAVKQLQPALGQSYRVYSWEDESSGMTAVLVEKNVMLYIMFFIVIVAAFGICCTLVTFVVVKTRDIGVIKALGATNRQISSIFLCQSMGISILGVIVGTTLGLLAVAYRNPFLHLMRNLTGIELFPQKLYYFSELPAQILPHDILIICGGSLLICMLASAFPAWHASRLNPVEALRHE